MKWLSNYSNLLFNNWKKITEFLHFNDKLHIATVIIAEIILLFCEKAIVLKSVLKSGWGEMGNITLNEISEWKHEFI